MRLLLALSLLQVAVALNNTQGKTPPMGFNPWTAFGSNFKQSVLLEVADAMVKTGLVGAGFKYMNLDCGWSTGYRDGTTGELQVDTTKFPNMTDYGVKLHEMGLKFGMYAGGWHAQCCHRNGNNTSWQHWDTDVALFKKWKIDYLKSDPCVSKSQNTTPLTRADVFNEYNQRWDTAFQRAGYLDSVFFQGSGPTRATNRSTFPILMNSWRTTGDVKPTFESVMENIHANDQYAALAGPGHWNDADMLQCGQPGISNAQCRTVLSLWSVAKSPLLIGADVRRFNADTIALLTNMEMIAVSQDDLGEQGRWVMGDKSSQVWSGRLSGGRFVVVLVNMDGKSAQNVTASWSDVLPGRPPPTAAFAVRDAWAREGLGIHTGSISLTVAPHDSRMLTLMSGPPTPTPPPTPPLPTPVPPPTPAMPVPGEGTWVQLAGIFTDQVSA
jgi:alpha-galactosidase